MTDPTQNPSPRANARTAPAVYDALRGSDRTHLPKPPPRERRDQHETDFSNVALSHKRAEARWTPCLLTVRAPDSGPDPWSRGKKGGPVPCPETGDPKGVLQGRTEGKPRSRPQRAAPAEHRPIVKGFPPMPSSRRSKRTRRTVTLTSGKRVPRGIPDGVLLGSASAEVDAGIPCVQRWFVARAAAVRFGPASSSGCTLTLATRFTMDAGRRP